MSTLPLALEDAAPAPLAERLRPRTLAEVIGQPHLLGPGRPLRVAFERCRDFDDVCRFLTAARIARPAIFLVAGVGPGERVVIEHEGEHATLHKEDTAAANSWRDRRRGWRPRVCGEGLPDENNRCRMEAMAHPATSAARKITEKPKNRARFSLVTTFLNMPATARQNQAASMTPSTTVMSSFFAGAEIITFFTVPRMCFLASFASVKCPVDSTTTCTPTDSHGSAPGSRSLNTLMVLPSIVMPSAPAEI